MPDRPPPQSLEAERAVLGAVLLEPSLAPALLIDLPATAFLKEGHRDIWRAIQALVVGGDPVDVLTVAAALRRSGALEDAGGPAALAMLQEEGTLASQVEAYVAIVREHAVRRELIRLSHEAAESAYDDTARIEDTLGAHVHACMRLDEGLQADEIVDPRVFAEEIRAAAPLPRLLTGLGIYDRQGGLTDGDLHLLAARPALGKTAAVLQIAHHVTHIEGLTAYFCSAEMSRAQIGHRLARLASPDEIAASGFYVEDPTGPTTRDVVAKIRRAHARYGIRLAVVDHAQEIRPTRGHETRRDLEIREIAAEFRDIAKRLGIAMLVVSQLNREVEKRQNAKPMLADLRDGGALEELSATVTFLWTAEVGHEDQAVVPVTFSMRKNRHGPLAEWRATFIKADGRMEDRP